MRKGFNDIIILVVCLLIIGSIFIYRSGSYLWLYIALISSALFVIAKNIIARAHHGETNRKPKKPGVFLYKKWFISVTFLVFFVGIPSMFCCTPLRLIIPTDNLILPFVLYEVVFVYIFVSLVLQQSRIRFELFRKILIVSTVLILVCVILLFYHSDFDRRFIILGIIALFFSYRLYRKGEQQFRSKE